MQDLIKELREQANDPEGIAVLVSKPGMNRLLDHIGALAENQLTQYDRDMAEIADFAARIITCPGGRPIMDGYVCIHCGQDTSVDRAKCGGKAGAS